MDMGLTIAYRLDDFLIHHQMADISFRDDHALLPRQAPCLAAWQKLSIFSLTLGFLVILSQSHNHQDSLPGDKEAGDKTPHNRRPASSHIQFQAISDLEKHTLERLR